MTRSLRETRDPFRIEANDLELETVRIEPEGGVVLAVLGELPWFVKDLGVAGASPLVGFPDDRAARNHEGDVLQARPVTRVGPGFAGLVEEHLRASGAVGSVVERAFGARLEPLAKAENGHELIVVALGGSELRNADANVVDEAGQGQRSPPAAPLAASAAAAASLCLACQGGPIDRPIA